jgi:hypothetical protein
MIRARWPGAGAPCSFCTGEASPMSSAVCSQTSTAGRHPGVKMMPGGGIPTSGAPITARLASGPCGHKRHAPRATMPLAGNVLCTGPRVTERQGGGMEPPVRVSAHATRSAAAHGYTSLGARLAQRHKPTPGVSRLRRPPRRRVCLLLGQCCVAPLTARTSPRTDGWCTRRQKRAARSVESPVERPHFAHRLAWPRASPTR